MISFTSFQLFSNMAGRKTCINFHSAIKTFATVNNLSLESLYCKYIHRRLLRTLARNVRKSITNPEDAEIKSKPIGDELLKVPKKEKIRNEFSPFQIHIPDIITAENQYDCLAQVVTPLSNISYQEQLTLKWKWAKHTLHTFQDELRKEGSWQKIDINRILHQVIPSPITEHYRNKDELCVHMGVDGNPKTVGLHIGSAAKGNLVCVRSNELINMKDSHKRVAQLFEQYVASSPIKACHHFKDGGHWRNLIVRSSSTGDLMAIVVIHPQTMEPEKQYELRKSLAEFFSNGDGREAKLSSLYFQACPHTRCTHDQAPFQLLLGKPFLEEQCLGQKIRVSPDSFFQINTPVAEILYETVLQLAEPEFMTTVLDVCCGVGTFATIVSPRVRGVVGIESIYSAVRDARANAATNNCANIEIIPGLVEKKLPRVIDELSLAPDIVAVINPGRSGVDKRVIRALRECKQIEKVVYISCNASGPAMKNFVDLCVPSEGGMKKWSKGGLPFTLKNVVPIDMFPHTTHCEMVLQFHRRL